MERIALNFHAKASLAVTAFFVLAIAPSSHCQVCKSPATESFLASAGANQEVHLKKRALKVLQGNVVVDANGEALPEAIIDVRPLGKGEVNFGDVDEHGFKLLKSYEVKATGEFCIDLPAGNYELRFGAAGGFNHTYIQVRISKWGSTKPLEIRLTPGT